MLLLLIRTVDAIDLEGPRCASIPNRFFNMIPKKIDEGSRYYRLTEEIHVPLFGHGLLTFSGPSA